MVPSSCKKEQACVVTKERRVVLTLRSSLPLPASFATRYGHRVTKTFLCATTTRTGLPCCSCPDVWIRGKTQYETDPSHEVPKLTDWKVATECEIHDTSQALNWGLNRTRRIWSVICTSCRRAMGFRSADLTRFSCTSRKSYGFSW